mgnify:CR=1
DIVVFILKIDVDLGYFVENRHLARPIVYRASSSHTSSAMIPQPVSDCMVSNP